MDLKREEIAKIVEEVVRRYAGGAPPETPAETAVSPSWGSGIFETMDEAVAAAGAAQKQLVKMSVGQRRELIAAMRTAASAHAAMLSEMAVSETGMGRVEDKLAKHKLCIAKTPGVEDIFPTAYTGDGGLTIVEMAPYGVIGSITPSTNPSTTVINNALSMVSAGNSVVFNPHPQARRVSQRTLEILNDAVTAAGGPENLLTTVHKPDMNSGQRLMKHPEIRLLAVTGGPALVHTAMLSGKKVIAAGPGNPPVVVDETADIAAAAADIVTGAAFDCNIMCIAEKEIFVVREVFDRFREQMLRSGCYELNPFQLEELMRKIIVPGSLGSREPVLDRNFVGKPPAHIAKAIGLDLPASVRLLIAEVPAEHPLVFLEQLMPVLPLVKVANVSEGIERACEAEAGCFHTAAMHSKNVENLSRMAQVINTTIFVKNAPTLAGLGFGGEGSTTLTIATPTGEGITTARTFTRQRRCALVDYFRIV